MRKFFYCLWICPGLIFGDPSQWEAKSEGEALFLRRIADFWQEGEYQIAKSQMEEFLTTYPNSAFSDALSAALGDLALREKNYSTALNYYAKITNADLCARVFFNRMQCLYSMEWYATLADECEAFLQKELQDPQHQLQTTYYLAIALYQQCLNASKEPELLLKLAQRARPAFETLFQSEWKKEVAAAFAHLLCILKEFPRASSIYSDLAQQTPEAEEDLFFQAALIQAEYDKEGAAKAFEIIAYKGKGKAQEAAYNRLVLCFDAGQYETILQERDQFLSQIPPDRLGMGHLFIGRSWLATHQYPEAKEALKHYLLTASSGETLRNALIFLIDASFRSDDRASLELALARLHTSFPNDPEIAKGRFSRALMLKKEQRLDEARQELNALIEAALPFPEAPQATFELAHLDYQADAWSSCRDKSRKFLEQFPNHDLAPYAWHYLISASAALSAEKPQDRVLKQQLALDLEMLLQKNQNLSPKEQWDWQFLFAKTHFELGAYEEAIRVLQPLIADATPFSKQANALLLIAFCYRDGRGDTAQFCSFAEQAIEKQADLIDPGPLHAALFNAYLALSQTHAPWIDQAANHLWAAFECQASLQKENILWLANYFYGHLNEEEKTIAPLEWMGKAVRLFETVLQAVDTGRKEDPSLEPAICKLAKLYQHLARPQDAVTLLQALTAQPAASPEAMFLLATSYAALGDQEKALHVFDTIAQERADLRTAFGAAACLESARLRRVQWEISLDQKLRLQSLTQLKDLALQKTLSNEPIHLEAALDYIDLQTQCDPNPLEKQLALLIKTKNDFENATDLLTTDYHKAREHMPHKNQIYQSYIRFMDAEIFDIQAALSQERTTQKELQAKAKEILLQIVDEKAHDDLVVRARKRLKDGLVSEQQAYTEMNSKVGNLTRSRPEFKSGSPSSKQLNLRKLSDADGLKFSG